MFQNKLNLKSFCIFIAIISLPLMSEESQWQKNLKGQKYLFENGWRLIPSATKSFAYYKEQSLKPSAESLAQAIQDLKNNKTELKQVQFYLEEMKSTFESFKLSGKNTEMALDEISLNLRNRRSEIDFSESYQKVVIGYAELAKNTREEREYLQNFFGNYVKDYDKGTHNLNKGFDDISRYLLNDVEVNWKNHFKLATDSFENHYESSTKSKNSIAGVWELLKGYAKAVYYGVAKPLGLQSAKTFTEGSFYLTKGLMNTIVAVGSSIYSSGVSLYMATSYGYKLISPTLEGGALGCISALSYLSTYSAEKLMGAGGAIAKYGIVATGGVASGGHFAGSVTYDAGKAAAYHIFNFGAKTGEAVIEQAKGAMVLGYTALTQLPAQVLLGAANATLFIVYDGPKILIAKVNDEKLQSLPAGTVIDLNKIDAQSIEEVEVDDQTKRRVLESLE